MKNTLSKFVLLAFFFALLSGTGYARECTACKKRSATKTTVQTKAAVCKRAQSTAELNINNVRALINAYGNMWYDGSIARYNVPRDGNSTPLFCAALWIGGTDVNDQLRIAALTFGSAGDDYWPGPLTVDGTADVTLEVCNYYDQHFKITQEEVRNFMSMFDYPAEGGTPVRNDNYDEAAISDAIKNWPAHGNFNNQSHYLAPFCDVDGDGEYSYQNGDYPYYDFDNELCPRTLKAALKPGENYTPKPTMEDSAGIVHGGLLSDQVLKGDQTIWWVFNDMGNVHTESGGASIGMEIRAQAFAFSTNNEINNMTFYSYEIINRSTYELRNTYFSQWVDPDLGSPADDYVGCDVKRGLGYCYNGKPQDDPGTGRYSGIPPAVGIDFFQGPYMDADGKDNPKIDISKMRVRFPERLKDYEIGVDANGRTIYDTISLTDDADLFYPDAWYFTPGDSVGNCAINGVNFGNNIVDDERFGMRRFVYYEIGNAGDNVDPKKATDYYNYLQGKWRNGRRMTFGGNALNLNTSSIPCDFMFPGDSDPLYWGTNGVKPDETFSPDNWTEVTAGNPVGDRRFMQSAGPFTLMPGSVNYITVGIPFAQASSGNAWSSVELLREIDDVCQALFENCFKVLDGPDAPTVVAQELSNEVILYLTYENPASNNYGEKYSEVDPAIVRSFVDANGEAHTYTDEQRSYIFEGYQIYQLVDDKASIADINDPTKARLVAQCDVENYYDAEGTLPIGRLVNYTMNTTTGLLTGNIMVNGTNSGIKHVFHITSDAFATGTNATLVNNKEYYFIAVAYAQNRYKEYSQTDANFLDGQKEPYLAGRKSEKGGAITRIVVKPHDPSAENGGTVVQAEYNMCPNITRIEGYGNGGRALELTDESIQELMGAYGEAAMEPGLFTEERVSTNYRGYMTNPAVIAHPRYKQNAGPLDVRVIDPLSIVPGKFYIQFDTIGNEAKWRLSRVDGAPIFAGDTTTSVVSDFTIGRYNEQLFLDLGIAVAVTNPKSVATDFVLDGEEYAYRPNVDGGLVNEGAVLSSSKVFADESKRWLNGVPDDDNFAMYNWIHSGAQYTEGNLSTFVGRKGIPVSETEPYLDDDLYRWGVNKQLRSATAAVDKYEVFEDVVSGEWAPYGLTSLRNYHPAFSLHYFYSDEATFDSVSEAAKSQNISYNDYYQGLRSLMSFQNNRSILYNNYVNLPSVRIVLTADQSKWTRCPVIEMCDDYTQSEGNARRFQMRKHLSVNKDGKTVEDLGIAASTDDPSNPAYIDEYGMGWFPGYAICTETGERLNIMFGEDSRFVQYNGRDMMWNPVSTMLDGTQNYVFGGRHYIYVMNATTQLFPRYHDNKGGLLDYKTPSYDAGRWGNKMLRSIDRLLATQSKYLNNGIMPLTNDSEIPQVDRQTRDSAAFYYSTVAWVNMPMVGARFHFDNPKDIPTDVTITINVNNAYGRYWSSNGSNATNVAAGTYTTTNSDFPLYMFELTDDVATLTGQATAANAEQAYKDSILSLINVVPNPYYSYSSYETASQLETKVRFINVPERSTISIYTVDGTLVRRLGPSPSSTTTVDWDLHNHRGLPIAGGMYLVHFDCPGIGQTVVKWFGTMRPVDLNSIKF